MTAPDQFGRYDPSRTQLLVWAGTGVLLALVAEPLVLPYFVASMILGSTYLFGRNGFSVSRTLLWTVPTAALTVLSAAMDGWSSSITFYLGLVSHCAFYLVPRLRTAWYASRR